MTISLTDGAILAIVGAGWLVLAIWLFYVTVSIRKINRRARAIAKAGENADFVSKVENSLNEISILNDNLNIIRSSQERLSATLETAIKRVGVVRFDAFEDVGGRQSFAVALLNDRGDGVVISAINGRNEGRSYAKFIKQGRSEFNLTVEEKQAISEALTEASKELVY